MNDFSRRLPAGEIRDINKSISETFAIEAINTAKKVLKFIEPGPPIYHKTPNGVHVDIPIMYQGFALDRIHFDPARNIFLPKGKPHTFFVGDIDEKKIIKQAKLLFKELRVVDAVEYREPEAAWIIPVAWRYFIVAHIKVSHDGKEIIPDYGLTGEVKRRIL